MSPEEIDFFSNDKYSLVTQVWNERLENVYIR